MATTTEKPIVTTTADSSAEPNPNKTVDPTSTSTDKSDSPSDLTHPDESEGSKTTETDVGSAAVENSGPAKDIEKKMRRAERFGVPVKLSEQEKRNSRAERFGVAPSSNGSEASKNSEELKRKARAERFGIAAPAAAPTPTTATDEDAKKKARLARFTPYSKPDSVEEEKRKQRAARFSNPSTNLSHVDVKGDIETEVPGAGEAGGEI